MEQFHGTTILCVRRNGVAAMAGDGQVTLGNIVFKGTARKVRRVYHDRIMVGFAGATADAFTLVERFEGKLEKHSGILMRASGFSDSRLFVSIFSAGKPFDRFNFFASILVILMVQR